MPVNCTQTNQQRQKRVTCVFSSATCEISMLVITVSTLAAVFAEVSMNTSPFSAANCSPSLVLTARLPKKEHAAMRPHLFESVWRRNFDKSTLPVLKIRLVADEHDRHVWVSVRARLFKPPGQVVEALSPGRKAGRQAPKRVGCLKN